MTQPFKCIILKTRSFKHVEVVCMQSSTPCFDDHDAAHARHAMFTSVNRCVCLSELAAHCNVSCALPCLMGQGPGLAYWHRAISCLSTPTSPRHSHSSLCCICSVFIHMSSPHVGLQVQVQPGASNQIIQCKPTPRWLCHPHCKHARCASSVPTVACMCNIASCV